MSREPTQLQRSVSRRYDRLRSLASFLEQTGRRSGRPDLERAAEALRAQVDQALKAIEDDWSAKFQVPGSSVRGADVPARTARAGAHARAGARSIFQA